MGGTVKVEVALVVFIANHVTLARNEGRDLPGCQIHRQIGHQRHEAGHSQLPATTPVRQGAGDVVARARDGKSHYLEWFNIFRILNKIVSYRATGIPSSRREDRATDVCASTNPQAPTRWCWKRPEEPTSHTARWLGRWNWTCGSIPAKWWPESANADPSFRCLQTSSGWTSDRNLLQSSTELISSLNDPQFISESLHGTSLMRSCHPMN